MSANLEKLKTLLAELFMLDQADLDFGIYRVMNAKRAEVTRFLDTDLLPQVRQTLAAVDTGDRAQIQDELAQALAAAQAAGFTAEQTEQSPKVKELRARLAQTTDPTELENEVFSDLANFFRRYYQDGDFLALRRYKAGVYAIPYEGEEVTLHWANADQYYIKTSEYLRDYTFKLQDGRRVHFKLVEADTEADNKKPTAGQERRFILCGTDPLLESEGELIIRFEYRPDTEKRKQAELNTLAGEAILNVPGFAGWKPSLARLAPTEKNPDRKLLDKHLADYTARNTFDYFIHKDLGGFLRRELDFFIKNEIMFLDDIETEQAPRVEQYLAKIKAIRAIARKIIAFLEQLENFQKKLWLKKKFIVETNYCVTLDRVPETLYPQIAVNDAQWSEWERLFAISEIAPDLFNPKLKIRNPQFLKANPFLVLDTKFFLEEFKQKLLASEQILCGAPTLDEAINGVAIHSDNFQAPSLLLRKHAGDLAMIYADPPYNTGTDGFVYKDSFQHSTWLSMMANRFALYRQLLRDDAALFLSVDDSELHRAISLLEIALSSDGHLATFARRTKSGGGSAADAFAVEHDYVIAWAKSKYSAKQFFIRHDEEYLKRYSESDADGRFFWDTMERTATATTPYLIEAPDGTKLKGRWFRSEDRFREDLVRGDARIVKLTSGWSVQFKQRLAPGRKLRSLMHENEYRSQPADLHDLGLGDDFSYPKTLFLLERLIESATFFEKNSAFLADFFAGSGTTGHAAISLNRQDGGRRKYLLCEMGNHFDTVLKPRLQKVIYSKDWKDGKPVSRVGSSHLFKYLRLESYEDALNNLELKRAPDQDDLLRQHEPLREDYLLRYQLDVETRDSASLLNLAKFTNPFAYQLKIATGSVGESRPVNVDLVETFNYLLGLRVAHIDTIRGFKVVQGLNPDREKVLVLWRNVADKPNPELDTFFQKQGYTTKDQEFALIYVNGDNNLENLKRPDDTWKVRRIEDEFKRLMFDVQDV
ncbi:MAG: site-specific DNA-methyltransferase [Verrucomicrobiota bacterium]|jgi:adenine-specific DNA-methyltransferase